MKRRVSKEIRYREPELLRTGMEGFAEDGLGAAPRLHIFMKYAQSGDGSARNSAGVLIVLYSQRSIS